MLNTSGLKFYEQPSYDRPNNINSNNLDNKFTSKIPPIPKLRDPNIHYRCPNCFNFPYIVFMANKEDISYVCACPKDTKYLNIKELFVPENKHLTFLNNINENQIKGFKCEIHKSENSNKNKKFKYFCTTCNYNICKDCLLGHLNKDHDVINLEFQKLEMNKKIELINNKLNEIKKNNEENKNIEFAEEINNKTHIFEKLDNGNYKEIENKKVNLDNFVELINIIINDYNNYPNYYHFFNIHNIYNILFNEKMKDDNDNKNVDIEKLPNQEITVIISINGETRNTKCNL